MRFGVGAGIIIDERILYILIFGGNHMEIMFEKCLRDALQKRGKTQRELAAHLSVSTQAVSKWCRGENMPDIVLLPKIAYFLNVSVDALLGVGEERKQEKIQEYRKKGFKLAQNGRNDERIEIWREAYSEFPNDMAVNEELMYALSGARDGKYNDEALTLGERILQESTDERQRSGAIQILCRIHSAKGNKEKAKEYANMSSNIHMSRNVLLSRILDGDEGVQHNMMLMLDCLDIIQGAEGRLAANSDDERTLQLQEFYLKMMELFFDDGFYGFYALYAVAHHKSLAKIYLFHKKDEQKAIEHLNAAVRFAKQYDDLPDQPNAVVYTSTLLQGIQNTNAIFGVYSETECELLLNFLSDTEFDNFREKDWFKAIAGELEAKNS